MMYRKRKKKGFFGAVYPKNQRLYEDGESDLSRLLERRKHDKGRTDVPVKHS
jgi:hypothetical protein